MSSVELVENADGFCVREDGGQSFGTFGAARKDGFDFLVEDFTVEEEDGAKGLILSGGGDAAFNGKVDEEGANFGRAHFGGVLFVVIEDVAADPIEVGFFGAIGVMFGAQGIGELVE